VDSLPAFVLGYSTAGTGVTIIDTPVDPAVILYSSQQVSDNEIHIGIYQALKIIQKERRECVNWTNSP